MRRFSKSAGLCLGFMISVLLAGTPLVAEGNGGDLNPTEAYAFVTKHEDAVIIDVRSQAEYAFLGHPPKAYNLPLMFWNPGSYGFEPNPGFKSELGERFSRETPVLFICRSGGRSAKAAEIAQSLGFKEVYNIVEGFEGDKSGEGFRTVNGWKNSGLPYSFKVTEDRKYRPAE